MARKEARERLAARWREQAEIYPAMRTEIPLEVYIKANLRHVMRENLLKEYART